MRSSCWEVSMSPASPCNAKEVSFNCQAIFLPHELLALNVLIHLHSSPDRNGAQWWLLRRASHAKAPFSPSTPPVKTSLAHACNSLFRAINSCTASLINSRLLLQSQRQLHFFSSLHNHPGRRFLKPEIKAWAGAAILSAYVKHWLFSFVTAFIILHDLHLLCKCEFFVLAIKACALKIFHEIYRLCQHVPPPTVLLPDKASI